MKRLIKSEIASKAFKNIDSILTIDVSEPHPECHSSVLLTNEMTSSHVT